jgi:arylsulfatase A-like enzyme
MEVFAGFTEHADYNAGRVIDEIERQGRLENTLIFYIWGDNGSSAEGLNGTISEQLAQNGIPTRSRSTSKHSKNSVAWMRWAARRPTICTTPPGPGRAAHRTSPPNLSAPISAALGSPWPSPGPKGIRHDATPRAQFHHVNDIVPTIYEVTKITPPRVVHGVPQDSIDGISMAYTFADATAKGRKTTQFFDIMASRGIYHEGWFACAMGPREPWVGGIPKGTREWSPEKDVWELYNLEEDWSQANDLAARMPEKVARMKDLFLIESARNKNLPIGGGLWSTALFHPEDAPSTPLTDWIFEGAMAGMPESAAPKLGKVGSLVTWKWSCRRMPTACSTLWLDFPEGSPAT